MSRNGRDQGASRKPSRDIGKILGSRTFKHSVIFWSHPKGHRSIQDDNNAHFLSDFCDIFCFSFYKNHKISLGTGLNKSVERAIRVHANFAGYVPFALFLIAILEINKSHIIITLILCYILLIGRIIYAWGVSTEDENFSYRVAGMVLTFSVIVFAAAMNVAVVLFSS